MNKLHKITSKRKKEKELALSLFRIPINFFAENNKKDIKTTSNDSDKIKVNPTTSPTSDTPPDTKIKLSPGETATHTITFEEVDKKAKNSSKKESKQNENTSPSSPNTTEQSTTPSDNNENNTPKSSQPDSTPTPQPSEQPNSTQNNQPDYPQPVKNFSDKPKATDNNEDVPNKDNGQVSEPNEKKPSDDGNTPQDDNKKDKDNKDDKNSPNGEDNKNSPDDKNNKNSPNGKDNKNSPKDKAKDRLKDKFGKTKPGKKLNDAKGKAKDKLKNSKAGQKANDIKDKVTNNPAVSKALDGVNKAKEIKDKVNDAKEAVQNLDTDKMHELAGDTAVKIASKAGDAITPGLGQAISAADKVLGKTTIGKFVKKIIGCITCSVGCLIPLLVVLIPVLSIMWIANLFGGSSGRSAVVGEVTEEDFEKLQEASTAYSMISYEEDTTKRSKHTFWKDLFGTNSKYPIEESLDNYLENYYYYTDDLAQKHNTRYETIIEKHLITKINKGDLTSFGMSFELLISHYNLSTLKAPSSSPQRTKEVDGKTVTYYLDTNGEHMQLFEDVLKSTDPETMNNSNNLLVSRFNGQVSKKWFIDDGSDISSSSDFSKWLDSEDKKENVPDKVKSLTNTSKDVPISLSTILNTKIKDVYIKEYNELRDLSLRDLLEITSTNSYDTQYYASLVRNILKDTSHIGNIKMNKLFTVLTKRLASLELMTYMLYYQKYEKAMESFTSSIAKYDNSNRFDSTFFDQFMTLSHVQHFIALSSSIDDPSLAYEIAVASFEAASQSIEIEELQYNYVGIKKYTNWFATYHFTNSVYATDDGVQFYMNISDVIPTYTQQQLFDKYNVNRGIYDKLNAPSEDMDESEKKIREEENAELNQKAFFEIFETATGIDTAFDSNGGFSLIRTPRGIDYNCAQGKFFPIDPNASEAHITQYFNTEYPAEAQAVAGHAIHHGIDYGIYEGTQIYAATSGTAYALKSSVNPETGKLTGYGYYVKIIDDKGYTSIYAHGKGEFDSGLQIGGEGKHVEAGDPIMKSGNTGASTGPHLHFEVRDPSWNLVNPEDYLYGNL